jgi:hypothetical protein
VRLESKIDRPEVDVEMNTRANRRQRRTAQRSSLRADQWVDWAWRLVIGAALLSVPAYGFKLI